MGFLSKLFGFGGEPEHDMSDPPVKNTSSAGMLRTARGEGYDKAATFAALDKLSAEIQLLAEAFEKKQNGLPYTIPQPQQTPEIATTKHGGFDAQDVNGYIAQLNEQIARLRQSL